MPELAKGKQKVYHIGQCPTQANKREVHLIGLRFQDCIRQTRAAKLVKSFESLQRGSNEVRKPPTRFESLQRGSNLNKPTVCEGGQSTSHRRCPAASSSVQSCVHLIEVKYSEDTRPGHQLQVSSKQHETLRRRSKAKKVTLHTILLAVGGLIYTSNTLQHL